MLRRGVRLLCPSLRDLVDRLDYFEKEVIELKAMRSHGVGHTSDVVRTASRCIPTTSMNATQLMEPGVNLENPLTPQEFVDLHQFYALQPLNRIALSSLLNIKTEQDLHSHAHIIRNEYLVRVAQRARSLNNAPIGLARMPSIRELRKWYEWSFHDVLSVPPPTDAESALRFDKLIRRVFLRHYNVSKLLSQGMLELSEREHWSSLSFNDETLKETFVELQHFFDEFCKNRVRLRFFVGNYMYLSGKILKTTSDDSSHLTDALYFDHDPEKFVGQLCLECSLLTLARAAIASVKKTYPTCPEIELLVVGDDTLKFPGIPYIMFDVIVALIDDAVHAYELHPNADPTLPRKITVCLSQRRGNEGYCLRISDTAGGMPLADAQSALMYWSSMRVPDHGEELSPARKSWINSPIRLPYAYCAAQAIGGDVTVASIDGYGTDRQVHFPSKGIANVVF